MILPIRLYGDPVLRQKARPITDFSDIPKLAENMLETMFEAHGVGIAAPQIGLPIRMFVAVEFSDDEPEGEVAEESEEPRSRVLNEFVVVNPVLEVIGRGPVEGLEGCLSIPGIYEEGVPRAQAVRLKYQNERGEHKVLEAEDYLARVFQHEFDHLEGKLFLDYLPRETVNLHREDLTEMQRKAKTFLKEEKDREKALKVKR
jgi:peptide deformylase